MAEESPENQTHVERVRRAKNPKSGQALPPGSKFDWPKNLNELLEWYSLEVEDVSKAAQLRIQEATKLMDDCARGKISLEEAAEGVYQYSDRWRDVFHRGVRHARGMTDEQIYKAMDEPPRPNREGGPKR
jgi:hypothetical protein